MSALIVLKGLKGIWAAIASSETAVGSPRPYGRLRIKAEATSESVRVEQVVLVPDGREALR